MKITMPLILGLASGITLATGLPADDAEPFQPLKAQWIWAQCEQTAPFQFVRFRQQFSLEAKPEQATVLITADTFYRLWINGRLVMHGPARSSAGKATVDPVEAGSYLAHGANLIEVEVFHGVARFEALAQAPGFLCELRIRTEGKEQIIATDANWEASEILTWSRQSLRFNYQRGWMEDYDGRRALEEKWQPAVVLGPVGIAPWRTVEMRDIPLPAPLDPIRPATVVGVQRSDGFTGDFKQPRGIELPEPEWKKQGTWFRRLDTEHLKVDESAAANPAGVTQDGSGDTVLRGEGASVTYDLGKGGLGFWGFAVSGQAGQALELAWNERLSDRDHAARPVAQTGNNAIRYVLRDGRQSFLGFFPQFARFVRVVQRGEGTLTLHQLGLTEFRFGAPDTGSFACSDEGLNRVYEAARWTSRLNTLDAFMDCPHRERNAMYSVEAFWIEKAIYTMFGDLSVSRRMIRCGADSIDAPDRVGPPGMMQIAYPMHLKYFATIIPSGPFFWILHLGLNERYSGDVEWVKSMLPAMRRTLEAFRQFRNAEGLLENMPFWIFLDYSDVRTDGVSVVMNGLYAKGLDEAARLERLAGDPARADEYAKLARQARESLNRYCAGDSFYPDVLTRNAAKKLAPSKEASETTQNYVMWCDVPPPERMKRMWQELRDDFIPTPLKKVQPIRGLSRGGLYTFMERMEVSARLGDQAALARDIKAMFLPMVDSAPGTLWEDPMATIALCHSIGCGVGGIMTEEILGLHPDAHGVRITPHHCGTLTWCRGHVTTPRGRLEVSWEWKEKEYRIEVTLPKDVEAEVVLPAEAKAVWQSAPSPMPWTDRHKAAGRTTISVKPGIVVSF